MDNSLRHEDVVREEVAEYEKRCAKRFKEMCEESYNKSMENKQKENPNG